MANFTRHCLSFFRSNKIPYYYSGKTIAFSCPWCHVTASMDAASALWQCTVCDREGSIITLSSLDPSTWETLTPQVQIINPRILTRQIVRLVTQIQESQSTSPASRKSAALLRQKVEILADYIRAKEL